MRNTRQLTDQQMKLVVEKLTKFIGSNTKALLERPDGTYLFREFNRRVYYVSEKVLTLSSNVAPQNLVSLGTCFGKFTKSGKFVLLITCLAYIAPYAQHKIWLKANAETQFLYGHNVLKSGLGRITENTPQFQGVVVYNMNDVPLGLGIIAKSTVECKNTDPLSTVCFHVCDIGEFIRNEQNLMS